MDRERKAELINLIDNIRANVEAECWEEALNFSQEAHHQIWEQIAEQTKAAARD